MPGTKTVSIEATQTDTRRSWPPIQLELSSFGRFGRWQPPISSTGGPLNVCTGAPDPNRGNGSANDSPYLLLVLQKTGYLFVRYRGNPVFRIGGV